MAEQWLSSVNGRTNSITTDTSSLALNVISSVAFENTEVHKPTQGHVLSLRDALVTVMSTSISSAVEGIMPVLKLPVLRSLLPANMKSLLLAMQEFRQYTDETVIRERKKVDSGEARAGSLISTLIKANQGSKAESGVSKARLSDSELRGNIFIFTIGGLESTSITLSYALALLAAYPDIQNWVVEELDEVLHDERNGDMGYTRVFPQLKRVIAIMVRPYHFIRIDYTL
jgi:cytochrome P450